MHGIAGQLGAGNKGQPHITKLSTFDYQSIFLAEQILWNPREKK